MYSSLYSSANKRQRGVSLPGLLIWSIVIVLLTILGMRLIPSYVEFAAVKQTLVIIANDPELRDANTREIRSAFDKYAAIDNIESVNGSDIVVNKQGEQLLLSASYTVTKPLFANLSLLIDFDTARDR
jgi:hypothetical protein